MSNSFLKENGTYIHLFRKFKDWEWYSDQPTCRLFIHLLITVNYNDGNWKGKIINRGSIATGRIKLSLETGLSEQQIRTSLIKLESTSDITIKNFNKYSVILVNNFDKYQIKKDDQPAKQPTNNQQITNKQPTNNHNQRKKESNNKIINNFFDSVWKLYPKKLGKNSVKDSKRKELENVGFEKLEFAINNYKKTIIGKDDQFTMYGSTFFNGAYNDYLPENYESIKSPYEYGKKIETPIPTEPIKTVFIDRKL